MQSRSGEEERGDALGHAPGERGGTADRAGRCGGCPTTHGVLGDAPGCRPAARNAEPPTSDGRVLRVAWLGKQGGAGLCVLGGLKGAGLDDRNPPLFRVGTTLDKQPLSSPTSPGVGSHAAPWRAVEPHSCPRRAETGSVTAFPSRASVTGWTRGNAEGKESSLGVAREPPCWNPDPQR
ncbi:hypothetical protein HJG60_008829 [Phyllostomus discolor]|uniref:Uncharacterized protein n=1 Tax=Phyllostomus discolor TaxID=89673 RepID=A0A833YSM0_9CHIR|nr:hypothetical protein HJG60_008829 [Phyllostomus discolor]